MTKLSRFIVAAFLLIGCSKSTYQNVHVSRSPTPPPVIDTANVVVLIAEDLYVDYSYNVMNQIQILRFGRVQTIPGPFTATDTVLNEYTQVDMFSSGFTINYLGAIPLINPDSVKMHGENSISFTADTALYNKPLFQVVGVAWGDTVYQKFFVVRGPFEVNVAITSADSRPSDRQAAECYNMMIQRGDQGPAELWGKFYIRR